MKLILIWPYELQFSNRTHFPRISALCEKFSVILVTRNLHNIDSLLKTRFHKIIATKYEGFWTWLIYFLFVIGAALKYCRSDERKVIYVFYNHNILFAMAASLLFGIKIFIDFLDDPEISTQVLEIERRKNFKYYYYCFINWLFGYFTRHTDRIIGYSAIGLNSNSALPKKYQERYHLPSDRIIIVPNGTNLELRCSEHYQSEQDEKLRLIYVGIISPRRKTNILLEQISKLPEKDLELILIGESITKDDYRWIKAATANNQRFIYLGPLPHAEVLSWIGKSHLGIYIADGRVDNYRYTHPIKVLEYLAMGKPVLAPCFAGIREIIRHQYNGLLFNEEHPEEIPRLLQANWQALKNNQYSANVNESVMPFDWKVINNCFFDKFNKIVKLKLLF